MGLPIVQLQWTPCWSWRKILLMQLCLYKLHGSYLPPQLLHLCHLLPLILAPGMDPLLKHLIAVPCHSWSSYRCILMSSNHQRLLSPPPYVGAVISLPFLFMSFFIHLVPEPWDWLEWVPSARNSVPLKQIADLTLLKYVWTICFSWHLPPIKFGSRVHFFWTFFPSPCLSSHLLLPT